MSKKILLSCYEVPGYGGASTASYKLFSIMQRQGLDISYLNLIDAEDAVFFRYMFRENYGNPKALLNVHNCVLDDPLFSSQPGLENLINTLRPDILVNIGYIAALLMKRAAPQKRSIFITSGCQQAKAYIAAKKAKDVISLIESLQRLKGVPVVMHRREIESIEGSDLVITHSDMIKFLIQKFSPVSQVGKIYSHVIWFAEWIYEDGLD
jgi:hypothetical protein